MYPEIIYENYISKDIFDDIFSDEMQPEMLELLGRGECLTINEKLFYFTQEFNIKNICPDYNTYVNMFFGKDVDLDLIKPRKIAKLLFNETILPLIIQFLEQYDSCVFWKSLGISKEKGKYYTKKLQDINNSPKILDEIINEISDAEVDKNIICKMIIPNVFFKPHKLDVSMTIMVYRFYEFIKIKYPRIVNVIVNNWKNSSKKYMPDIASISEGLNLLVEDGLEYNPKFLHDLIVCFAPCDIDYLFPQINKMLVNNNTMFTDALFLAFKRSPFGYDVYNAYLDFCDKKKINPVLLINKPEEFFINSYKVPQLKPLYHRYFPDLTTEDAIEQTIKCYNIIFCMLKAEQYLEEDCFWEEFIWAFGLTDKYPYGFRKIVFQTSKEKQANGAFLCLLTILGYETQEIKDMLHRSPDKSLINKTFDLTIKDNTKMSKEYAYLLKLVESSGLPIINNNTQGK